MNRWLSKRLFPELVAFGDDADEALRDASAAWRHLRRYVVVVPLTLLGFGILWAAATLLFRSILGDPVRPVAWDIALMLLIPNSFLVFQYLMRNPIRRELRRKFQERGVPVCIRCGYDLRGQREARCPECGAPFNSQLCGTLDRTNDEQPPAQP